MKDLSVNRVELLHAINRWCAGEFNPLIAFPRKGGFKNVVYIYDEDYLELRERSSKLCESFAQKTGVPLVVFTEPLEWATGMALTYKEWIEAGSTMKAIELKTQEPVFVLPVSDDNGSVIKYVSSERAYRPDELKIIKEV